MKSHEFKNEGQVL